MQAFGSQGGAPAAKKADKGKEERKMPLGDRIKALLTCLRPAYWQALIVVSLLYFARFDASFITLRAKTVTGQHEGLQTLGFSMVLLAGV